VIYIIVENLKLSQYYLYSQYALKDASDSQHPPCMGRWVQYITRSVIKGERWKVQLGYEPTSFPREGKRIGGRPPEEAKSFRPNEEFQGRGEGDIARRRKGNLTGHVCDRREACGHLQ
jgi:hypothetical protein